MFKNKRRIWVYILLFCLVSINYMDRTNFSVASKPIAEYFNLSPGTLGLVLSSFSWLYILALIPAGILTDRWGTRLMNAISIAVWSIATILTGAATSFFMLLLSRLGMGLGESVTFPACARVIRQWSPASERALAVAAYNTGAYAGPAFGAIFVAWLVTEFGWRASFFITGAMGFVWLIIWLVFFNSPEKTSWLSEEEKNKILVERGMTLQEEQDKKKDVSVMKLLKYSSMWGVALTQGCAVYTQYLLLTWLPNYLGTVRHLSIMKSGLVTSLPYFISVLLGILLGMISDRLLTAETRNSGKRRYGVVISMLISSVVLFTPFVESVTMLVLLITISLTFISTAVTLNITLTNDLLKLPSNSGKANSLLIFGGNIFGLLAPIVTGYVIQFTGNYVMAFVLAGILLIAGATVSLTLTHKPIGQESDLA
jgi:MFS family permease